MKIFTPEAMQSATSFLLGKTHGGIVLIISSDVSLEDKIVKLIELEAQLRSDIEKLYYSDIIPSQPPLE